MQQERDTSIEDRTGGHSISPLGVFLRGVLMGAADIVPGVSGGTMAFITGIYQRLINAISAFDFSLLAVLRNDGVAAAWRRVDGSFLLLLGAGIACSVLTLARLIAALLETQPVALWSFFFGLILASALLLTRHVERWSPAVCLGLFAGVAFAATIGLSPALALPVAPVSFFFAGFIAICAMILPGISGSFILVLLGLYPAVLEAIRGFDVFPIAIFAAGAACGLLSFSRALRWLLATHHSATLATLTGFLFGSLPVVWPWKLPRGDSPLLHPVLPDAYRAAAASDGTPTLLLCLLLMVAGAAAVWLLENRWGGVER